MRFGFISQATTKRQPSMAYMFACPVFFWSLEGGILNIDLTL
jgi:hypothetical protein